MGSTGETESQFPPAGFRRVLVVDDDQEYLQDFLEILKKFHYEATSRITWHEALDLLKETEYEFDFLICAVNKPNMDGFKLLEHAQLNIPKIMIYDGEDLEMARKGLRLGANYLLKSAHEFTFKLVWTLVYREGMEMMTKKAAESEEAIEKQSRLRKFWLSGLENESPGQQQVSRLRSGRAWRTTMP